MPGASPSIFNIAFARDANKDIGAAFVIFKNLNQSILSMIYLI
jgi:hypothetical protein